MIYLDPPYNVHGQAYPYLDAFTHDTWLTMMEERLKLAWTLLSDDGCICVSIDDHEVHHLRKLMEELYGEAHFVATVVWQRAYGHKSNGKHFGVVHEYILIYAKGDPSRFRASWQEDPSSAVLSDDAGTIRLQDGQEVLYSSVWKGKDVGYTATGTKELRSLFSYQRAEDIIFPTAKPVPLLRRLLRLGTAPYGEDLVLDCFAGSASLAHAVMSQNREDGANRRFILVEQSWHFDATLVPRVMKVMYCPSWREGVPQDYPSAGLWDWPEWVTRSPRLVQVIRLESYEDSLHNIVFNSAPSDGQCCMADQAIHYRVALPLRGDEPSLGPETWIHPFSISLEALSERGAHVERVDLVETFNAMLGLSVERVERWINPVTTVEYLAVVGRHQHLPVLVLWREGEALSDEGEISFLESRVRSFERVYMNGASRLPGISSLPTIFRTVEGGEAR